MAYRVEMFGDDAPTEINPLDGRIKSVEKARSLAEDEARSYAERHSCKAGQVDLVTGMEIIGSWVWNGNNRWWEQAAKDEIDEFYDTLNQEIDEQLYGKD